jgi:large subunit ribosomal protein L19e
MTIATIRRLAAGLMRIGQSKVRFDPARVNEADKALTRADVKNLIQSKVITKAPIKGRRKKPDKRRRGAGSKKGSMGARAVQKDLWMAKVRAQRKLLNQLLSDGALPQEHKRKMYGRIKSGLFKSKRALLTYLKEGGLIPKDYEPSKQAKAKEKPKKEASEQGKEQKKETKKEADES